MQSQQCTAADASAAAKTQTLIAGTPRCSRRARQLLAAAALLVGLLATTVSAKAQTPATPQKYEHDKWKTEPRELFFEYEAFVLSFDDVDDTGHQQIAIGEIYGGIASNSSTSVVFM